jgi:hypothetical protein
VGGGGGRERERERPRERDRERDREKGIEAPSVVLSAAKNAPHSVISHVLSSFLANNGLIRGFMTYDNRQNT